MSEEIDSCLTNKEITTLKEMLLAEQKKMMNKDDEKEQYCIDRNELIDPLDEACANVQTSHEIRLKNRDNFYLRKINKTLNKIDRNEYEGRCSECEGAIGLTRLFARPTAELCIQCKEEAETEEKSNFFMKRSKSFGKTIQEL